MMKSFHNMISYQNYGYNNECCVMRPIIMGKAKLNTTVGHLLIHH